MGLRCANPSKLALTQLVLLYSSRCPNLDPPPYRGVDLNFHGPISIVIWE